MTGPAGGSRRPTRLGRPQRAGGPLLLSAVSLAGWGAIAHNSGSGWVQALGAVIGGILVVGLAGPAVAVTRARVRCTGGESDGTAGRPVEVHVQASTRLRVRPLDPAGPETFVGPTARGWHHGGDEQVVLIPEHRGVHDQLRLEVASAAPFGLLWWRRRLALDLPATVHVAPAPGPARPVPPEPGPQAGTRARRVPAPVGEPRGVRPYRPGDSRRVVHWPATAHTGMLMVREMEAPAAEPVTVTVDLPADDGAAERVAGEALGTVSALLDAGVPVVLVTDEAEGPLRAPVADRRGAGRRLARAVAGGAGPGTVSVARGRR